MIRTIAIVSLPLICVVCVLLLRQAQNPNSEAVILKTQVAALSGQLEKLEAKLELLEKASQPKIAVWQYAKDLPAPEEPKEMRQFFNFAYASR